MAANDAPILVFVLSEASPVLTQRWIDEGKLPFLARMAQCGSAGKLQANLPYNTVQAFADIFTGRRAQQHGAFDYVQRDSQGQLREVDRKSIACSTLWDILDRNQRTCGIVNLPLTWPPQPVHGYMISGQDSRVLDRRIASPPELYEQLTRKFGRYRLKDIFPGGRDKQDYLALFPQEIDWQFEILAELIATQSCDFFMTFVSATAMAQHYFWSDMEDTNEDNPYSGTIESVYRRLDAQLARLSQIAGPRARMFVISECGAGPLKHGVDINAWLNAQGFLHYQDSGSDTSLRSRALSAAVRLAKRHLPAAAKSLIAERFPSLKATADTYMAVAGIDWSRTTAYSRGKESFIYLNLAGREPDGIVPAEQYSTAVARIAARLDELLDPETGEAVVSRVFTRDELYPGCMHPGAPDLVIDWKNGGYMPTEANRRSDQVFGQRWRAGMRWPTTGSHRPEGIFFAQGPGIEAGHRVQSANTLDLLPTWLRMLDVPAAEDLPGRAIECCCGGASKLPSQMAS
jgi:predicted AlkP superfamily phosphohydrolase/phosphomutase